MRLIFGVALIGAALCVPFSQVEARVSYYGYNQPAGNQYYDARVTGGNRGTGAITQQERNQVPLQKEPSYGLSSKDPDFYYDRYRTTGKNLQQVTGNNNSRSSGSRYVDRYYDRGGASADYVAGRGVDYVPGPNVSVTNGNVSITNSNAASNSSNNGNTISGR